MSKKLVLIDGHAIIHRAFHALPPLTTREGQPVNAVYGFATMILRSIEDMKPTHMAVAFDLPAQTFRQETYALYQSHRPRLDDTLRSQIPLVFDLVKSAGVAQYSKSGFEADDCLGTLAVQAVKEGFDEVIIVTGDKDILQLVNKKVKVFMPTKGLSEGKIMDEEGVLDYLGVRPDQIIEYKALVGDSSDNYPGVPGIGPKTAIALIKEFGTVDEIYKNLDKIPERVRAKLEAGREGAEVSHKLATIVCDVDINVDFDKAVVEDFSTKKEFLAKLKEFNFRSLYRKMTGEELGTESNKAKPEKVVSDQMGLLDN